MPKTVAINGNLAQRVSVDTSQMDWTSSPSKTVWRKRMHLVGAPESGQVTSIVRYEPHSQFPSHDHPEGEEILVLDGIFSDEHGDWPAGTYLLNPEGFRHAPFSREGCRLFVKLRQFPGLDRRHVAVDTATLPWQPGEDPGVDCRPLYEQSGYTDTMRQERWAPGTRLAPRSWPGGAEYFVLDGDFRDEAGEYLAGSWLRLPAGAGHSPQTETGCTLYVKTGGLRYLRGA